MNTIVARRTGLALVALLVAAVSVAGDPVPTPVTADQVHQRQQQKDASLYVLDVRAPEEYAAGHVPGAVNIPHDQIASRLAEVPKDKDVVLYCRSGRRSALAGEVLAGNGYTRLQLMQGDMPGWMAKDRPVEAPRDPAACVAALKSGSKAPPECSGN
jgi:rhodanese-related sulfurtransferase